MLKSILLALFLCSWRLIAAQDPTSILSLKEKYQSAKTGDDKTLALIKISQFFYGQNLDSAIWYAKKAIEQSSSSKDSLFHMSRIILSNYIIDSTTDTTDVLEYIEAAIDYEEEHKFIKKLAISYNALANYYFKCKKLEDALSAYQKAIDAEEINGNIEGMVLSKFNLSFLLKRMGRYEDAYENMSFGYQWLSQEKDTARMLRAAVSLSGLFSDKNRRLNEVYNLDSAIYYARIGYDLSDHLNFDFGKMKSLDILITALTDNGFCQNALDSIQILTTTYKQFLDQELMDHTSLKKAQSFLCLHQPQKAIDILKLLFKENYDQENVLLTLSNAYGQLNNHKKALFYYEQYHAIFDSISWESKKVELSELQTKYETEKITNQKILAEERAILAETESKQNLILFILASIIATLIVIAAFFYFSRLKQTKKAEMMSLELRASQRRLALEKQYRDSELKALKAQMNPHFIFNVLNSIQEYIVLNDSANASDYLSMFSHLIRSYLDQSGKKVISLQEETETLNRYLQLEALRFDEDFSARIEVDDALDQEIIKIPPMIIQPYVENAIKHGLFNKEGAKSLEVAIERDGDQFLKCVVQDDGIGRQAAAKIKASKPNMHESFALGATQSRMELSNQQSANKISIDVSDLFDKENNPIGTKVTILIPIKS